ncbi:hypothetical protein [Faecalicatena contorta]|uniref:hypothetical protein n=1 Tax=Faecalicatena contorta TaxID=39482 RepID=UPI001F4387BF|nr:hypothetical protein [Faecalicatena contorta]MCF2681834.1 hypothetical protein [Faecalicatena contorta]
MPRNQFQRMVFAFLTVLVTVHAYVFYSLYVVNGTLLMSLTGEDSVIHAIHAQGGVYMFGKMLSIWSVILIEFFFAYLLECVMGSPCSFRLASKVFDPRKNHPMIFESAIICATVGLMCPSMSFLAAWFYYPYYQGFCIWTLLANWLKLVCLNFPFAFFTQLFFIQPFVRTMFKLLFRRDLSKRAQLEQDMRKNQKRAQDEIDAIDSIMKRVDEIRAELEAERTLNK